MSQKVSRVFTCPQCGLVTRTVYYAPWAECTNRHEAVRMQMRIVQPRLRNLDLTAGWAKAGK